MYGGRPITVPSTADIERHLRIDGTAAKAVQRALDLEWDVTHKYIREDQLVDFTHEVDDLLMPMAVELLPGDEVMWGIHVGHRANQPQPSPFIELDPTDKDRKIKKGKVTLEFAHGMLVRAYGGDYTPPLPWMKSARQAPGGRQACTDYWRAHAYQSPGFRLVRKGTLSAEPPVWFALAVV